MEQKTVEALKKAFETSVAVFEFAYKVRQIHIAIKTPKTTMHKLHILTLGELNQDQPDFKMIDRYLATMEELTILNEYEKK